MKNKMEFSPLLLKKSSSIQLGWLLGFIFYKIRE